jgi:hypothetical protein
MGTSGCCPTSTRTGVCFEGGRGHACVIERLSISAATNPPWRRGILQGNIDRMRLAMHRLLHLKQNLTVAFIGERDSKAQPRGALGPSPAAYSSFQSLTSFISPIPAPSPTPGGSVTAGAYPINPDLSNYRNATNKYWPDWSVDVLARFLPEEAAGGPEVPLPPSLPPFLSPSLSSCLSLSHYLSLHLPLGPDCKISLSLSLLDRPSQFRQCCNQRNTFLLLLAMSLGRLRIE